mmetsp:Transcript_32384/g.82558  ORF Transcript_32384/g.82558 Transcript_32384/m.82558 type:complete len:203 (-) Transcript_32384:260-868(-)
MTCSPPSSLEAHGSVRTRAQLTRAPRATPRSLGHWSLRHDHRRLDRHRLVGHRHAHRVSHRTVQRVLGGVLGGARCRRRLARRLGRHPLGRHPRCRVVRPVDLVARHARLVDENVAHEPLVLDLLGRRLHELGRVVLRVDVVADPDELLLVVEAAEQDDRHSQDVVRWYPSRVGGIGLEDKLVGAHLHGSYVNRVEQLVVVV